MRRRALLEVTAPLPQAQLVETVLLNQVTFQTAIASKAARCRIAAGDAELVDFAARRALTNPIPLHARTTVPLSAATERLNRSLTRAAPSLAGAEP